MENAIGLFPIDFAKEIKSVDHNIFHVGKPPRVIFPPNGSRDGILYGRASLRIANTINVMMSVRQIIFSL